MAMNIHNYHGHAGIVFRTRLYQFVCTLLIILYANNCSMYHLSSYLPISNLFSFNVHVENVESERLQHIKEKNT